MEKKKTTSITITGESFDDLKTEVAKLAKMFGVDVSDVQLSLPLPAVSLPASLSEIETPASDKKARKSKKADASDTAQEPGKVEAAVETPKAEKSAPKSVQVSAEDAEKLFRQVLADKGVGVAKPLIESFGVPKFRDLPAEKYGELIAKCNEILVA